MSKFEKIDLQTRVLNIKKARSFFNKNQESLTGQKKKVFGIGLGKTGVSSLCEALSLLGYKPIQHPQSLRIIKYFYAAVDTNVAIAYKKLDLRYPGSKFILTVRNIDTWVKSARMHDERRKANKFENIGKHNRLEAFGSSEYDPEIWKAKYETHVNEVLNYFQERPQDLLVFNVCAGEGWEKLCPFLNKGYPNIPFPYLNKAGSDQYFENPIFSAIKLHESNS